MSVTRTNPGAIDRLAVDFATHLAAENKSPRTIDGYAETLRLFHTFLVGRRMPITVAAITREHVEAYLIEVLTRHKPSTAVTR
ncbi:MAG: phage integrase N-terminal SAM-like domain-containing protein [Actinomycetota bacterium]|nr:phage integrase N-terminal SAM-like domain-containing protein [Actinomycetota bacterium]